MKKTLSLIIFATLLFTSLFFVSACGNKEQEEKPELTRMQMDINPSIEFMIDDEGKVASVTALNDDGSIIIAGEVFVGLTAEEAAKKFIEIAEQTGYLIESNADAVKNQVSISISGATQYAKDLQASVVEKAKEQLASLNISAEVEIVKQKTVEELKAMVEKVSTYTKEEIDAMSESELYKALVEARKETAHLLTAELQEAYYNAKTTEIKIVEREEVQTILNQLGALAQVAASQYQKALETYEQAANALEDLRYSLLIAEDSVYQLALKDLRAAKQNLIDAKAKYAEAVNASPELQEAVQKAEQAFAAAEKYLNECYAAVDAGLQTAKATLDVAESAMKSAEEIINSICGDQLKAKAQEIENKVNQEKDKFFEEFETKHKADIEKITAELEAQKAALKKTE